MGNAALVPLVKARGVVYIELGSANTDWIAGMMESAPGRAVGHFGGILVYEHVYDGTFARTRLAEDDYIMLDRSQRKFR